MIVLAALNVIACAINIGLYAAEGNPWCLGVGVANGLLALMCFAAAAIDRRATY